VAALGSVLAALPGARRAKQPAAAAVRRPALGAGSRARPRHGDAPGPFPPPPARARPGPYLAPGSNPAVLPADVLIADRSNSRLLVVSPSGNVVWQFPRPGDLRPGQRFAVPDDAFFTPNRRYIVVTEEDDAAVSLVDIATHRLVWQYGTPGSPGWTANKLWNPDDAMMLPNGDIVLADIKNCSLLVLRPPSHVPLERIGENTRACYHAPPLHWGSPNGLFAMAQGPQYLATEINGDWVDAVTLTGRVLWSTHPPGVAYPSDSSQIGPNRYLTVDYSDPGQIVEFNREGRLLWRYGPASGPGKLDQPSLCQQIPRSVDLLCNDDYNDRVIVVDPRTNRIVWQYGHTGVAGSAPGYLDQPDGVDLAPPYSFMVQRGRHAGLPPRSCVAAAAAACSFGTAAG